jgi:hypothetical protein
VVDTCLPEQLDVADRIVEVARHDLHARAREQAVAAQVEAEQVDRHRRGDADPRRPRERLALQRGHGLHDLGQAAVRRREDGPRGGPRVVGLECGAHRMTIPPLTATVSPVTKPASSETR